MNYPTLFLKYEGSWKVFGITKKPFPAEKKKSDIWWDCGKWVRPRNFQHPLVCIQFENLKKYLYFPMWVNWFVMFVYYPMLSLIYWQNDYTLKSIRMWYPQIWFLGSTIQICMAKKMRNILNYNVFLVSYQILDGVDDEWNFKNKKKEDTT